MSDIASSSFAAVPSKSGFLSGETLIAAAMLGFVVVLVALVAQYGYPLLITLAVTGAFLGLAMVVGLTALDLVRGAKRAKR